MSNRLALIGALSFAALLGCSPPTPKPTCSGCIANGSCVSELASATSAAACGLGGQVCAVCSTSENCTNGLCVSIGTGGGTGGGSFGGGAGGGIGGGAGGGDTGGGGGATGGGTGGGATGGGTGGGATGGGTGGGLTGGGTGGGDTDGGTGGGTGGGATGGGAGGGATGGGTGGGMTGGGTGSTCSGGLTACNGRCVDLRLDAANCNLCGRVCAAGQSCQLGVCTSSAVTGLVFSEVNPGHGTIELFNGGAANVNLLGYSLQYALGDGGSGSISLPSYDVAPQSFVVFGQGSIDAGFISMPAVAIRSGDLALRLLNASAAGVDFVRTGSSTVPPPTGTTWVGANAINPTVSTAQSLVRNLFGPDSNSAVDWDLSPLSSPLRVCARPSLCNTTCTEVENDRANCGGCGNTCPATQVCRTGKCVAGGGALLISEYRIDPVPMVELYNPGSSPVPLSGYRVQVAGSGTFSFTFPMGRVLQPGEFLALYAAPGQDDAVTTYTGAAPAMGSFTDTSAVTLFDGSTGVDFVRFGASSALPPAGLSWFGVGPTYPPISSADLSVHRRLDLADADDAFNWLTYSPGTTGFACQAGMVLCGGRCVNTARSPLNCGTCGTVCTAPASCVSGVCSGVGFIVLSRLSNVAPERLEIFNGTATSTSLDLHSVEWVTESTTDTFSIPIGTTVASGGYLQLIEGNGVNSSGTVYMNKQIDWTSEIAVSLKSPANTGIDFVRTGPSIAPAPTGTTWSGVNAANPGDTGSTVLERNVQLADSNTAAEWGVAGQVFGQSCGTGLSVCGAACVQLMASSVDCGTCGNVCPGGCAGGQCSKVAGGGGGRSLNNGRVRLITTTSMNSGRLEVFANGGWGSVCDDLFTTSGANVVCRDLGWTSGSFTSTTFSSDIFLLDDVQCIGTEATLLDCPHAPIGVENCYTTEHVLVTCQ